jgi:hypothetical protein
MLEPKCKKLAKLKIRENPKMLTIIPENIEAKP